MNQSSEAKKHEGIDCQARGGAVVQGQWGCEVQTNGVKVWDRVDVQLRECGGAVARRCD